MTTDTSQEPLVIEIALGSGSQGQSFRNVG